MTKFKKIINFILALLNFLFHFKPVPDDKAPVAPETYPCPPDPPDAKRAKVVFDPIP